MKIDAHRGRAALREPAAERVRTAPDCVLDNYTQKHLAMFPGTSLTSLDSRVCLEATGAGGDGGDCGRGVGARPRPQDHQEVLRPNPCTNT